MAEEYKFGIEEEYFVVDAESRSVQRKVPSGFILALKRDLGPSVTREMLQAQIEVMTKPSISIPETQSDLHEMRRSVAAIASEHGLSVFASGTHPTATWTEAKQTPAVRYDEVMQDLQMLGERNLLCGLHVHVELPDPDRRVEIMRRMTPYVPTLIALSTSSPFWRSRQTGLMGYRLAAYDELPRTGLPPMFADKEEYDQYIATLVEARVIKDSSFVWWALRPSLKHPTLELRAPDSCTRVADTLSIAAIYRCMVRRLFRNPEINSHLDVVDYAIAVENKWRAQRYGIHGSFVDKGRHQAIAFSEVVENLIAEIADDAKELGCYEAVARARDIVKDGTSADIQIAVYREAEHRMGSRGEAFQAVKSWLVEATLQ